MRGGRRPVPSGPKPNEPHRGRRDSGRQTRPQAPPRREVRRPADGPTVPPQTQRPAATVQSSYLGGRAAAPPRLGPPPAVGFPPRLGARPTFGCPPRLGLRPTFGCPPRLGPRAAFGCPPRLGPRPTFGGAPRPGPGETAGGPPRPSGTPPWPGGTKPGGPPRGGSGPRWGGGPGGPSNPPRIPPTTASPRGSAKTDEL